MMKIYRAFVCNLLLCMALGGCGGSGAGEVTIIGRDSDRLAETSSADGAVEGDVGLTENRSVGGGVGPAYDGGSVLQEDREIRVYVCGAVMSPGVVSLPEDSRAEDALNAAGGFAENAWREYVNLAERVQDGEKLYFPTLDETESLALQGTESAGSGLVNINTADAAALCTLPGIGESRANDIIAYREANGPFASCEDIMNVSGIKISVYSKISDKITVK